MSVKRDQDQQRHDLKMALYDLMMGEPSAKSVEKFVAQLDRYVEAKCKLRTTDDN